VWLFCGRHRALLRETQGSFAGDTGLFGGRHRALLRETQGSLEIQTNTQLERKETFRKCRALWREIYGSLARDTELVQKETLTFLIRLAPVCCGVGLFCGRHGAFLQEMEGSLAGDRELFRRRYRAIVRKETLTFLILIRLVPVCCGVGLFCARHAGNVGLFGGRHTALLREMYSKSEKRRSPLYNSLKSIAV